MMTSDRLAEIDVIVTTLLHIGERVVEVSRDNIMTRIWDHEGSPLQVTTAEYLGKKITEIKSDSIIAKCSDRIAAGFRTGENSYLEYTTSIDNQPVTYGVRVLTCHPDKNFLFVVIEFLPMRKTGVIEDKWKLALDAAGDGVWDTNLETGRISFSEKWREMFGYEAAEVSSIAQWTGKVHPDDRVLAQKNMQDYLAGKKAHYDIEVRYLCKDGTYKWILSRGIIISRSADGKPNRFIGTHTDINERKQEEERYAGTAQLLAKLINNLQTSIMVTDENCKIVFVNEKFQEMFLKDENVEPLHGMDMKRNLETRKRAYKDPEKFLQKTIAIFDRKEIVLNEEWELIDGRVLSRDYIPLSLGANSKGGIWKFRDITDQKNVDKRLKDQRNFYERILNAIPADIAVFDAEHRYLFVNKNAFKNDELREWMIGKTDEDYARHSNRPASFVEKRFALYDGAVNSGKEVRFIEKLINKEGKTGHHLRLVRPVFKEDGKFEFLMAYGLEITDLIVAQNSLQTSIETFSSAFDHSGIGMALLDTDGAWLNANKVLCDLTGYSKDELVQRSYHDITYPEDDMLDRPLIDKLLNKEIKTYTVEKRYVTREKKVVLVQLTVSLVWNNDDTPKFFIAQVVDITKKKELEDEIIRKNADLETTKLSLINKISQLEELSHIIAHNLRGPAGNVKMFAEVLAAKQNGQAAAENSLSNAFTQSEVIELINESSNALMDCLATLMKITEIKLNKEIAYDSCDMTDIINGIKSQLYGVIYEKQATIRCELEVAKVEYPKAYLENILYNFVSNALKYSKPDVRPDITISTAMKGDRVQVIVKDNGLGINLREYRDKIFKLNQVFHTGFDSKGVGLYITKTQVDSLGGKIAVESEPGEGSEFTVTL